MSAQPTKLILLIDDDPLVLQTISKLLERQGYLVRAFQNPKEAIQEAAMEDFDLVITDIRMPQLDGFQTIRYIREVRQEKGAQGPREIFITGYAEDYETRAKEMNPHAIIHKPFNLEEFVAVIRSALAD